MTAPPLPREGTLRNTPAAETEALRREYEDLRTRLAEIGRRLDCLAAECRRVEDVCQAPRGGVPPSPAGPARAEAARCDAAEEGPSLRDLIDALVRDVEQGHPAGAAGRATRPRGPGPRLWPRLRGAAWALAALSLLALALLAVRLAL